MQLWWGIQSWYMSKIRFEELNWPGLIWSAAVLAYGNQHWALFDDRGSRNGEIAGEQAWALFKPKPVLWSKQNSIFRYLSKPQGQGQHRHAQFKLVPSRIWPTARFSAALVAKSKSGSLWGVIFAPHEWVVPRAWRFLHPTIACMHAAAHLRAYMHAGVCTPTHIHERKAAVGALHQPLWALRLDPYVHRMWQSKWLQIPW